MSLARAVVVRHLSAWQVITPLLMGKAVRRHSHTAKDD